MKIKNNALFHIDQYNNKKNADTYENTFGPELIKNIQHVDYWVAAGSTGGTITGTARFLKRVNPECKVILVDPVGSVFTDGFFKRPLKGKPFLVEGVGKSLIPGVIDFDIIDAVINVTDEEAFAMCHVLAREEGIFAGGSGGANIWGAIQVARFAPRGSKIATLVPDSGLKYMSKVYNQEWLLKNNMDFRN